MKTLESPTFQTEDPAEPDHLDRGHGYAANENINHEVAEIRSHAETLGLSSEETDAAVADYLEVQGAKNDSEVPPRATIEDGLREASEKLAETDAIFEEMERANAEIAEALEKLIKFFPKLQEYLDRIVNENDPEVRKKLTEELQREIDKLDR